ncbi:hypothetical protein CDD80_6220 [Ophiocordyceps camponoti-rufipedis]|uniref:FMP27 GFWDK domain-containing protein n=1 Tax=Ophiocordyceps camponoti-rufipedis TaxID=2004952 RepID=A0A2C5YRH5_9HYPO|nr:hypothetical protein CDD80_6220 [Ophiocordyceps camponoti-rufipedis]
MGMGEVRVSLRDYPLPLLHIPSLKPGQSMRAQALTLKGNLVIGEEFQGVESTRRVRVNVIPAGVGSSSFAIDVTRTVSAIKSYSDVYMDINTALPTRITWCPSYQPAIQDMMMVVESFTKPQLDPSEQVGFWDKLRLNTHSHLHIAWKGDGDMHLSLKGTRDPYHVTGDGAGFLMCWRGDVRWNINVEEDPKRFMTVDSGEYILAIPDYSHLVRDAARAGSWAGTGGDLVGGGVGVGLGLGLGAGGGAPGGIPIGGGGGSSVVVKSGAVFKKVVMKLSGKVQWMAGLVFERAIVDGERNFHSKPHYEVVLKNPIYAKPDNGLPYDAFRGFRSRHIHLSIGVQAPADRKWSPDQPERSGSYNSVHLTPRVFTHFFEWWGLFSGPMSLPIRQGALFPGQEKNSKKFGRHLATVKYNLLLAPLFLSHIYKHKEAAEEHADGAVSTTGLKVRFENFMLDLHQRREEFDAPGDKKEGKPSRITAIKVHECQLDLAKADVRAVSASLKGTTTEAIRNGSLSPLMEDEKPDLSRFVIPDHDTSWIDMDDFVELDWILPTEPNPETKILPLAFSPRLTYFRQTDIDGTIAGDPTRKSPFGDEPTHYCYMTHDDDPKRVQARLIGQRLDQLEGQMLSHSRNVGEAELKAVQTSSQDAQAMTDLEAMRRHTGDLKEKKAFLEKMMDQMTVTSSTETGRSSEQDPDPDPGPRTAEFESDYENRFVIHNMEFKWNNVLRNIVLRYIHQVSQRRGFVYYLSRPAVKFLLDIVEEQQQKHHKGKGGRTASPTPSQGGHTANGEAEMAASTGTASSTTGTSGAAASSAAATAAASSTAASSPAVTAAATAAAAAAATSIPHSERDAAQDLEERIRKMIHDGRVGHGSGSTICDLESGISRDYTPQHGYHVRLIAPQIQLQSERNKGNAVLVTAKGMELKVVEVMDRERISDPVSGLVQRRMLLNMDSTQFFVARRGCFSSGTVAMYAGSRYGIPRGSIWPPWVPMEAMFDFAADPIGFKRVVRKTSAMLRYDKFNNLRLKYGDEVETAEGQKNQEGGRTQGHSQGLPSSLPSSSSSTSSPPSSSHQADSGESLRSDSLWVDFPQVRALCNSSEYYAIYVIVLDLLMYSEPLEKTRSERLEKIMLASDFSDLSGAPLMVQRLQARIKQMEDIKGQFQVYGKHLDRRGWEDRLTLERDLAASEDELFFVMKAITTAQQKHETDSDTRALLKWIISGRDIVWHLIRDSNEPLVELQLRDVEYDRTDNADGSHTNLVRVGKVLGLNLLPDATYPEMIGPYQQPEQHDDGGGEAGKDMIRVYWHMLEAIAGITVMDRFEVSLHPTRLQLEREAGKLIFDYVFPGMGDGKNGGTAGSGNNNSSSSSSKVHEVGHDHDKDHDDDDMGGSLATARPGTAPLAPTESGFSTRAGSLELRLRPTLASHATHERASKKAWGGAVVSAPGGQGDRDRPGSSSVNGTAANGTDGHGFRLFRGGTGKTMLAKKSSHDSLRSMGNAKAGRSSSVKSSRDSSKGGGGVRFRGRADDKQLQPQQHQQQQQQQSQQQQSDDLSKMLSRASNYMTFAYIRMPSVVLCLSYRGKEQRNLEDVHDFVFRMPTMEWQNKTWSNLDLALALKKAVVKGLISHTGAIIGNKLSKRRPNAEQRMRLRELANSSVVISSNSSVNQMGDESSSDQEAPEQQQRDASRSDDDADGWAGGAEEGGGGEGGSGYVFVFVFASSSSSMGVVEA